MTAPDEHWLLVKRHWLPIEAALVARAADGDTVQKIDSLAGQLPASVIDQLHYLRMERNALLHKNRPLTNATKWASAARETQAALEALPTTLPPLIPQQRPEQPHITSVGTALKLYGLLALFCACSFGLMKVSEHYMGLTPTFTLKWWGLAIFWLLGLPGTLVGGIICSLVGACLFALYWIGAALFAVFI